MSTAFLLAECHRYPHLALPCTTIRLFFFNGSFFHVQLGHNAYLAGGAVGRDIPRGGRDLCDLYRLHLPTMTWFQIGLSLHLFFTMSCCQ